MKKTREQKFDDFLKHVNEIADKTGPLGRAEMAVHITVSGINHQPNLSAEQKLDIVSAALALYRVVAGIEILHHVTTIEGGKDYGILLDTSESGTQLLRARLATAIAMLDDEEPKLAKRFLTLLEMIHPTSSGDFFYGQSPKS